MIIRPFKAETLADVKNSLSTVERILISLQQEQLRLEKLIGGSGGGSVSNAVYGPSWNGNTTTAPSLNAVYDKIETLGGGGGLVDGDYGDITVSGTGTVMSIDSGVVDLTKISPSLDAYIIAMAAAL